MTTTPDGLKVHNVDGVGLCVLAHEHNKKIAEQAKRIKELERFLQESGLCIHCGDSNDKTFGCRCPR